MAHLAKKRLSETNPISSRFGEGMVLGLRGAAVRLGWAKPLFHRHIRALGCRIIACLVLKPQFKDRLGAFRAINGGISIIVSD
jgi:hypothetical protein